MYRDVILSYIPASIHHVHRVGHAHRVARAKGHYMSVSWFVWRSQEPASRRSRGGELMSQKVSVLVSGAITDVKPFVFISAFSLWYACIIKFDDKLACVINLSFDSFFFFFFLSGIGLLLLLLLDVR